MSRVFLLLAFCCCSTNILVKFSDAFITASTCSRLRTSSIKLPSNSRALFYSSDANDPEKSGLMTDTPAVLRRVNAGSSRRNRDMAPEGRASTKSPEILIGRIAMTLFTIGLVHEFWDGETFLQQMEDGAAVIEKVGIVSGSLFLSSAVLALNLLKLKLN